MALNLPVEEQAKSMIQRVGREIQEVSFASYGACLHRLVEQLKQNSVTDQLCQTLEIRESQIAAPMPRDGNHVPLLPANEADRCAILWGMVRQAALHPDRGSGYAMLQASNLLGISGEAERLLQRFTLEAVLPVLNYLLSCFEGSERLLTETWRYKRLMEWFRYKEFEHLGKDNWKEAPLDADFRRFLMERGYGFPFSQPVIPDARPDIVLVRGEADPLPIEVKVFDGEARGKKYLRQGFGQAVDYARKYQSAFAVYLIFNVSSVGALEFLDAGPSCPFYAFQNQIVYIVPVQMVSLGAPSKAGGPKSIQVSLTDLSEP